MRTAASCCSTNATRDDRTDGHRSCRDACCSTCCGSRRPSADWNGDPDEFFARLVADAQAGRSRDQGHRAASERVDPRSSTSRCKAAAGSPPSRTSPNGSEAQAQISHMARHDALTNLPNRTLFREQLEQALRLAKRGRPARGALPRPRSFQGDQRLARPSRSAMRCWSEVARGCSACRRPTATPWRGSAATNSPSSSSARLRADRGRGAGQPARRGRSPRPTRSTAIRS